VLIVETIPLLRQQIRRWRLDNQRVALVPTMGNLHDGHLALVDEARTRADIVVASIFVNPMQFGQTEDLARYPRTLQQDSEMLSHRGVSLIFAPAVQELFPQQMETQSFVEVPELSTLLEGAHRPGHFRGVATIVSKLFNLIQPDIACFGEKDYQQLALIRKIVADMNYDIDIIGVPTVRAKDGLALSSRNGYLTGAERKRAPTLYRVMLDIADQLHAGARNTDELLAQAAQTLNARGFRSDELFIRDAITLQPLTPHSTQAVILMAAWLGEARLIDNLLVSLIE